MTRKVREISDRLVAVIAQWPRIEAIVLGEDADISTDDPYFRIDIDVYYRGDLPAPNDRRDRFGDTFAFETSASHLADTFLLSDLPVRIIYTEISRVDLILQRVRDHDWVLRENGTNMFYRLESGRVLHMQSDWLEDVRAKLPDVFAGFWNVVLESARRAMEKYVAEIGAASLREDSLFLLTSSAGFIRGLATYVFALNRTFEPSPRSMLNNIRDLRQLPEGFSGRLDSFLRRDAEMTPDKKRELAELLVRSLLGMA